MEGTWPVEFIPPIPQPVGGGGREGERGGRGSRGGEGGEERRGALAEKRKGKKGGREEKYLNRLWRQKGNLL